MLGASKGGANVCLWVAGVLAMALSTMFVPTGVSIAESVAMSEPSGAVAKLTASDAAPGDRFGNAVAVSGLTVIVGAEFADGVGLDSGSAYVFRRDPGASEVWREVAKLSAADATPGDLFGAAVAISGDTAVVGAPLTGEAGSFSGSAYVFERDQGASDAWGQVAKLVAPDAAAGDEFGAAVAISGGTVVVGSPFDGDAGFASGAAYVFERTEGAAGAWSPVAKLTASDAAISDELGVSVAISGDTVITGAEFEDENGLDGGAAYVFERNQGGPDMWGEVAKLVSSDGEANDRFGHSVAVSGDAAVVGAYRDDDAGRDSGAAYAFERDQGAAGAWSPVAKLIASDGAAGDWLAQAVAISGDWVVAGAEFDDDAGSGSGSGYAFELTEGPLFDMVEIAKMVAADGAAQDAFGGSVGISAGIVVVGAREDDDGGLGSGSAYVLRAAGLTLSAAGACPGLVNLSVSGATANGPVALAGSPSPGTVTIPLGPCTGTQLNLDNPDLVGVARLDESGQYSLERSAPATACGLLLQAIDVSTCDVSDVIMMPVGK